MEKWKEKIKITVTYSAHYRPGPAAVLCPCNRTQSVPAASMQGSRLHFQWGICHCGEEQRPAQGRRVSDWQLYLCPVGLQGALLPRDCAGRGRLAHLYLALQRGQTLQAGGRGEAASWCSFCAPAPVLSWLTESSLAPSRYTCHFSRSSLGPPTWASDSVPSYSAAWGAGGSWGKK